jgi:hypothetical protein
MKRFNILSIASVLFAITVMSGGVASALPAPTHHYAFDVDASDTSGTNDGMLSNGALIVADPVRGNVLSLDGIDDHVSLQYSNFPGGPTDISVFSVSAWIRIPTNGLDNEGAAYIYGEYSGIGGSYKNLLHLTGGHAGFDQSPTSANGIGGTTGLNDNAWHHIAYVHNASGAPRRQVYVDGVLEASDNTGDLYTGSEPTAWVIGARFGSQPQYPHFTPGQFDDLRFYDVALSASEVSTLYSVIPEPNTALLLGIGLSALAVRREKR